MIGIKYNDSIVKERNILGAAISQWYAGDWCSLIEVDVSQIVDPDVKCKLSLLLGSAYQQLQNLDAAREFYESALALGCDRKTVSLMMISGVYNALGVISLLRTDDNVECVEYFKKSIELGIPQSDASLMSKLRFQQQVLDNIDDSNMRSYLLEKYYLALNQPFEIGDLPHMEVDGLLQFEKSLKECKCYLEYGSGASTVFACANGVKNIISVESDKSWLESVKDKIVLSGDINFYPCYVNIGKTKAWGFPINNLTVKNFYQYCSTPWVVACDEEIDIDLVLIDGRFRVACFLMSLMKARPGTIILFDDYIARKHYHVVEDIVKKDASFGRMAKFTVPEYFNRSHALDLLLKYVIEVA